jgi:hypothetical protein
MWYKRVFEILNWKFIKLKYAIFAIRMNFNFNLTNPFKYNTNVLNEEFNHYSFKEASKKK